jgi:hypothetical protein
MGICLHVTRLFSPIQTHYCLLFVLHGSDFDGLQCQFQMSVEEQTRSFPESTAKTNNTLFIYTRNFVPDLLQYSQLYNVLAQS